MARTVKQFAMLPALSLLLALAALAVVSGLVPLPLGIWPGITLGLFAALAAAFGQRAPEVSPRARWACRGGFLLGVAAALLGIAVYVGLLAAAGRLG